MKKPKCEIWISQIKPFLQALHFSALDVETQTCINREFFYFNHKRFVVIVWAIIVLEVINVINVLCFSKSGLTTQNNRQYFFMYLFLIASAGACLKIRQWLQNRGETLARYYVGFTAFILVWHVVLSAMDLRRNPSITVFITGIFALSLLVRLKPKEIFTILPGSFVLLLFCARNTITGGIVVNSFIVTLVAILIACSRYFSTLEELGYRKKMILQADHRIKDQQMIKQLEEQQAALLYHSRELLFLWDRYADKLLLAGNVVPGNVDRQTLLTWLLACRERGEGVVSLQLEQQEIPQTYRISCTPILDRDGALLGAAGCLEPMGHKAFVKQEES